MLDSVWNYIYTNYYDTISSPFFHSYIIILTYLIVGTPFLLFDRFQLFQKYKIHKTQYPSDKLILLAFAEYILCEVLVYIPSTILPYYFGQTVHIQKDAPTIYDFIIEYIQIFITSDILFWFMHRLMHTKFMYKHVHSVHHYYRTPFAFCTQSHHPIESILMSLPVIIPILYFGTHVFTQMTAFMIILAYGVEGHSGYDFGLQKLTFGFMGFAPMHDVHHSSVTCNYGAYTTIMDRIMNTYKPLS